MRKAVGRNQKPICHFIKASILPFGKKSIYLVTAQLTSIIIAL